MNFENKKLGRGLGSLLTPNKEAEDKNFKNINISEIYSNKNQPRKSFKKEELDELAASIRSQGIIQPIAVRKILSGGYEIIAGERRWRASQIVGLHKIPCFIKDLNNEEVKETALIENIQRENLNPVEEALAYRSMLQKEGVDYEKISVIVGKSKSHISNMIRILDLEDGVLNLVISGKLSMGHARALIGVPNAIDLANEIIKI